MEIPIRWADLDPQGHVNNVRLVDYTQEARARFLVSYEAARQLVQGCIMVNQQVEYLRPVQFSREPLIVDISCTQVGAARFWLEYAVHHGEELVARVRTVMCPYDFPSSSLRRLTDEERRLLHEFDGPAGEFRPLPDAKLGVDAPSAQVWPRWSDCDVYGHVNNVATLEWLQEARVAITAEWDPAMARVGMGLAGEGGLWLVARQDVDYVRELVWRVEPWSSRVAPVRLGNTSVTLVAEVVDPLTDVVHTRGRTVLVRADATGRPVPLPDETRTALSRLLVKPRATHH